MAIYEHYLVVVISVSTYTTRQVLPCSSAVEQTVDNGQVVGAEPTMATKNTLRVIVFRLGYRQRQPHLGKGRDRCGETQ